MRKSFGFLPAAVLGMAALVPLPATALADRTIVVNGPDDFRAALPDDDSVTLHFRSCLDLREPEQPTGPGGYAIRDTDDPVLPLGTSKLGAVLDPADSGLAAGPAARTFFPASLATWRVRVQAVQSGTVGGAYAIYYPSSVGADFWKGAAALDPAMGWQTADAANLSLDWVKYDGSTNQPVSPQETGAGTVAAFTGSNGGNGAGAILGIASGCGKQTYFDRYEVGSAGDVVTFDFERSLTKVSIEALLGKYETPVAGSEVTIAGVPSGLKSTQLASADLVLEHKPAGAASFSAVGTATSTAGARVEIVVEPTVRTLYRWRYDGDQAAAPSTSPTLDMPVRARMTIKGPKKAKKLDRVKFTGKIEPIKGRVYVALDYKKGKGSWRTWASRKSKANGTYSLKTPVLRPGKYRVLVRCTGTSAALGGRTETTLKVTK